MDDIQDLVDLYRVHFDRATVNAPEYAIATLHMLIGSFPEVRRLPIWTGPRLYEDPRIHVFCLSPSRSGKGRGFTFLTNLAKDIGVNIQKVGDITSNALCGTQEVMDRSKDVDDPERYQTVRGYLDPQFDPPAAIIGISEAGELVTARPAIHQRKILDWFQEAINPQGSSDNLISKKTGISPAIEFNPECSFFFTTYKPAEFSEVVAARGFFQRCLLVVFDPTPEERAANLTKLLQLIKELPPLYYDDIINNLKRLRGFASNVTRAHGITISPDALDTIRHYLSQLEGHIQYLNDYVRNIMQSYVVGFMSQYIKLASHSALFRGSMAIENRDVWYVYRNFHSDFTNTLSYVSNNLIIPLPTTLLSLQRFQRWRASYQELAMTIPNNPKGWVVLDDLKNKLIRDGIFDNFGAMYYHDKLASRGICEVKMSDRKRRGVRLLRELRQGEVI